MVLVLIVIPVLISTLCLCGYLNVLYNCVRKVRIKRVNFPATKTVLNSKANVIFRSHVDDRQQTENQLQVDEYKQAPGPLPWPVLGSLQLLARYETPFQGFTELAKQYGNAYTLTLGTTRCLIINNLDLIREVLNQNGKFFGGRPDFLRFHILFGGNRNNSLALCDWSQLQQKRRNLARKHCSPRTGTKYFHNMSAVGCSEVHKLLERLDILIGESGGSIAIKQLLQQTCANMFCNYMCSLRFDYDDVEFQKIVRSFDEIFWEINQGYAVDFLPWLSPFYFHHMQKIRSWSKTIRKFILNRIIQNRQSNIDTDFQGEDFTDAIFKSLTISEGSTRDTLIYMLEDFIGGHSAVGNLVMLALAHIVKNPIIATKIHVEIRSLLGQNKRLITQGDADKMPFTMSTIYEVLRFCSSPIVPHVATEDVCVSGYGVTKGTVVFINNYDLNTSAKYWDNPKVFDPNRFLTRNMDPHTQEEQQVQLKKKIPYFIPFSIGKRTCIGQNLVKGFGFTLMANILQKYVVSCDDLQQIKTYPACVAVPPDTFSLIFTPRNI